MSDEHYKPPQVWEWSTESGGEWAKINRPTAGARETRELAGGSHPMQLYSLATPNGQKASIMLEELLAQGHKGAEYDAHLIKIGDGDQFTSGFVEINPNSKIPALLDTSTKPATRVFESGAILLYLAEKFNALIPEDHQAKTECMNWLFWQMGAAPYLGGGFGHFYAYAPEAMQYPIDRFTMEVKRQLDLLDKHLAQNDYMAGSEYSIADIAIWPWYGNLVLGRLYDAATFLKVHEYPNVIRWATTIDKREPVRRGRIVNRTWGEEYEQLAERHSAADIDEVLAKGP